MVAQSAEVPPSCLRPPAVRSLVCHRHIAKHSKPLAGGERPPAVTGVGRAEVIRVGGHQTPVLQGQPVLHVPKQAESPHLHQRRMLPHCWHALPWDTAESPCA